MFGRPHTVVLLLLALVLGDPVQGQEQLLLEGQAGLYPLRAYFTRPVAVGPAHLVVELGEPKQLAKLPEGRHATAPGEELPPEPPRELAVSVVMEMPDMVSAKPTRVKLTSVGAQRFEGDVLITMKGQWRMQFVVQTPEGEFRPLARFDVASGNSASKKGDGGLELCDPDASDVIPLRIQCFPDPARVGPNKLRVELPENINVPVMVGLDMPGLAVGIPPYEAARQDDGSYEALVNLPMAGYWQVRVDLNGRVLPPFALTVEEKPSPSPSRALLPIVLIASIPLLAIVFWRKRRLFKPVTLAVTLLLVTLGLALAIEKSWPSHHSSAMEMDMFRYDMGMGHLSAPLPVLEAKLEKTRFVTTRDYPATITPGKQSILTTPRPGLVSGLAPVGTVVVKGEPVAGVDSELVRAKSNGIVVKSLVTEGALVEKGAPVLCLADPGTVKVQAVVPLSAHGTLVEGLPVEVVGNAGQRAGGKLTFVSAVRRQQGLDIEAVIDNTPPPGAPIHQTAIAKPKLDPGLFAIGESVSLRVEIDGPRSTISVPREAIRETADDGPRVFLVSQVAGHRVAREQKVTLGESNDTHVEVLTGLSAGQTIVARLEPSLQDGDVVVRATLGEGVFRSLVVPGEGSH